MSRRFKKILSRSVRGPGLPIRPLWSAFLSVRTCRTKRPHRISRRERGSCLRRLRFPLQSMKRWKTRSSVRPMVSRSRFRFRPLPHRKRWPPRLSMKSVPPQRRLRKFMPQRFPYLSTISRFLILWCHRQLSPRRKSLNRRSPHLRLPPPQRKLTFPEPSSKLSRSGSTRSREIFLKRESIREPKPAIFLDSTSR